MIHSGFQLVEIFGAPKCVSKTFLGSSREKLQASEPNCPQSQKKLMVSKPDCPRNPKKLKVLTKDWPLCPKREPTALTRKLKFLFLRQKKLKLNVLLRNHWDKENKIITYTRLLIFKGFGSMDIKQGRYTAKQKGFQWLHLANQNF